jgi:hypothetical protein
MNDLFTNDGSAGIAADLRDEAVRRELGPAAWKFFHRVTDRWKIPAEDARRLVALRSGTEIDHVDPELLGEEQLERIGILVGIYKALHTVLNNPLADQWLTRPNENVMFGGRTPLTYMVHGGIPALRNVRKLLYARCAGNW